MESDQSAKVFCHTVAVFFICVTVAIPAKLFLPENPLKSFALYGIQYIQGIISVDVLHPSVASPPPPSGINSNVVATSRPAVREQADPSKVGLKEPMSLPTGVLLHSENCILVFYLQV